MRQGSGKGGTKRERVRKRGGGWRERGGETNPIYHADLYCKIIISLFLLPCRFLFRSASFSLPPSVDPRSSKAARPSALNERLISRVKLLAFTVAISTDTRVVQVRETHWKSFRVSFPLRSSPSPFRHPFDRAARRCFRRDYHFYRYRSPSTRKRAIAVVAGR